MNILVAGGAGFIGSHIVEQLCNNGHSVTIVDGMLPHTSGNKNNLSHIDGFQLHTVAIESCDQLPDILTSTDLVIDCMGWTRHLMALENPEYDLKLNVLSHLSLIQALKASTCKRVIYLGSRGQIGNTNTHLIDDDAPRLPMDIQGIHKTAAESHYRVYSKISGAKVLSLVIGNTFGPRMPMDGADIGLIGGFLRDALSGRAIQLYGKGRSREFTYAPDLAEIVGKLCVHNWQDFQSLNIPGFSIPLEELLQTIIEIIGSGSYTIEDWPAEVKAIDVGSARLCTHKIESWLGSVRSTPIKNALRDTIQTIKSNIA